MTGVQVFEGDGVDPAIVKWERDRWEIRIGWGDPQRPTTSFRAHLVQTVGVAVIGIQDVEPNDLAKVCELFAEWHRETNGRPAFPSSYKRILSARRLGETTWWNYVGVWPNEDRLAPGQYRMACTSMAHGDLGNA
jgi:hypothetical protein